MTFVTTVHRVACSQSERVVWVCEELEPPHTLMPYDREARTHDALSEYRHLHPMVVAPVVIDEPLVLVALVPDRATQIFERGRAHRDNLYICDIHNLRVVEGRRFADASIVAQLHWNGALRRDLEVARAELLRSN
ncbi:MULTISPECIES: hypothetical protein [Sphingobium]|uniref:hypothetical protein n=1 Tax=Sphingobium TaxID=165695 RepID=UPI000F51575A|nr:hypothetical protein [Sphingobium cloacae]|tara:strand:- start:1872 stop:2276 length:405 start_codon:yes stop_codon:yes gene_type:complete